MNMHATIIPDAPTEPVTVNDSARWAKRRRLSIGAVVLAVLIGAAAWFFMRGAAPVGAAPEAAPRVTVVTPGQVAVADTVRVTGSLAARRDMPVGLQGEGGQVSAVLAEAGQYVRRGQTLATIDRLVITQQVASLAASVNQARADATLAQSELDRAKQLVGRGFISKADIDRRTATRDSAVARVAVSQAQLREMQARMARLDVRAPADGLVLARNVEVGQVVGPGTGPLFRIAQNGALELRGAVAEQDIARLRVGQMAQVIPVGSTEPVTGRIWLLEPVIDAQTRQGIVRVQLERNPVLRVGAFASASITAGNARRPVLPQSAVLSDDAGNYVLVIGADNRTERRAVKVGSVSEAGIAIVSGLTGNERVVATAGGFLAPGEKVTPVRNPPARVAPAA